MRICLTDTTQVAINVSQISNFNLHQLLWKTVFLDFFRCFSSTQLKRFRFLIKYSLLYEKSTVRPILKKIFSSKIQLLKRSLTSLLNGSKFYSYIHCGRLGIKKNWKRNSWIAVASKGVLKKYFSRCEPISYIRNDVRIVQCKYENL